MDTKTRKTLNRRWRGRSHKAGGTPVRDLRDHNESDHPRDEPEPEEEERCKICRGPLYEDRNPCELCRYDGHR